MKGIDLQELLYRLDNYYLELRDHLGLSNNDTFGLEIECEETDDRILINLEDIIQTTK